MHAADRRHHHLLHRSRPQQDRRVSTAAGSVGSAVGQIATILGARAVGIAGGANKVRQCVADFGYAAAIDYKAPGLDAAIDAACPAGVNVYFDNTAGVISDTVYPRLAIGARVVICGTASIPVWNPWPTGPRIERHLLVKRPARRGSSSSPLELQGVAVPDEADGEPAEDAVGDPDRVGRLIVRYVQRAGPRSIQSLWTEVR